jgi:hypothetical protein
MDLILLRAYEGALVDVGVHFNVRVIAQLQSILFYRGSALRTAEHL